MYSTLQGAKKCAKKLKKILDESNLIYPLSKCQEAVAKAGGFDNWHTLTKNISVRPKTALPYDYWGNLLKVLPEPCCDPVKYHILGDEEYDALPDNTYELWLRDVLPFCMGMEIAHRKTTAILQPGAGKNQRNRLKIISGILVNVEGHANLSPRLDPESLTITMDGLPEELLPEMAQGPQFQNAVKELVEAGVLRVERQKTHILAPDAAFREGVLKRAARWKGSRHPEPEIVTMDEKVALAFRQQQQADFEEAGRKVPYSELDYRGITLSSRYRVEREFKVMKSVVDHMSEGVRIRVESIFCDSKAEAVYAVEVLIGMYDQALAENIHECFIRGTNGYNSIFINHGGKDAAYFEPYWPELEHEAEEVLLS